MTDITNPHDKFFKEVFSRQEVVADFLRNYLPDDVVKLIDLGSLEYTKDSFMDEHLREYFSDLLFKVYLKDDSLGFIYILFEHKSYQDPLTAFYILRYMVKIWEMSLKQGAPHGFPVIIPLMLYQGDKSWRTGINFRDLFDYPKDTDLFIPDYQYVLWDASRYSDEEIKGEAILRVALLILKYIFKDDLRDRLSGILMLLKDISKKRTGLEYIETILKYVVNAAPTGNINYEDLKVAVDEALPDKGGEIMPTIADTLREEGMQQGMQQGMLEEAREAVIDNLETRFDVIPQSIIKIINGIDDISILKSLRRKAVKVVSLDEFMKIFDSIMK